MIQGKGSRRVSLSALRFPYVKKQKENIESSKNNPSKRRCFERKMKYAAASWPSIIETQLYSFSAILVFHPIFLKYRSRDCSVTGCRNDVQKRAPFLFLSLSLSSTLLSRSSIFWNSREFIYELQSLTEVNSWYEIFFSRAEIWLYSDRRYKPGLRSRLFSKMRILCTRLSFAVSCFSILDASLFLI